MKQLDFDLQKSNTDKNLYEQLHQEKVSELSVCQDLKSKLNNQLDTSKLIIFTQNLSEEVCLHDRLFSHPKLALNSFSKNPFISSLIVLPTLLLIIILTRSAIFKAYKSCSGCAFCKCESRLCPKQSKTSVPTSDHSEIELTSFENTFSLENLPPTNPFRSLPSVPRVQSNFYDEADGIEPY